MTEWQETVLGTSVQHRPLVAHTSGAGPAGLILAATHGDEGASSFCAARLRVGRWMADLTQRAKLVFVEQVNPDGIAAGTRTNARAVDINRNFPTENWSAESSSPDYEPGPHAASEPETRALVRLLDELKPAFIITIHAPLEIVNYDGPALEIAQAMAEYNGYPVDDDIGYPTPGSFGTYAGIERGIPTVTLELGHGDGFEEWTRNGDALVAGLEAGLAQVEAG